MKSFDLPYNFDFNLIDFYHIYFNIDYNYIQSIYLPPFQEDYITAKQFLIHGTSLTKYQKPLSITYPKNRNEYQQHLDYINNKIPNKLMLLLQQNNILIEKDKLKYYIDNNINKFCVGSIEQAKEIKQLLPETEITGSITMKIMPDQLNNNLEEYKKYFNNFVLWFPYNRNIQLIKQLPKDFNYILLINCYCAKNCPGTYHWLAQTQEEENNVLNTCLNKKGTPIQDLIYIPPQHLPLFDPYISAYKLQGREYSTNELIADIVKYTVPLEKLNLYETRIPLTAYNL